MTRAFGGLNGVSRVRTLGVDQKRVKGLKRPCVFWFCAWDGASAETPKIILCTAQRRSEAVMNIMWRHWWRRARRITAWEPPNASMSTSSGSSFATYKDFLDERPEVFKLAKSLREEAIMSMPVCASHPVLRAGSFFYTIDGEGVRRVPAGSAGSGDPKDISGSELLFRVDDARTGARVAGLRLSRSGAQLAVILDDRGSSHVYIVDGTRVTHQEHVRGAMGVEFGSDPGILIYTVADETGRPAKVLCTTIDSGDELADRPTTSVVFEEHNPVNFVGIQRTKDWGGVIILSVAKTSSEAFLLEASPSGTVITSVCPRRDGVMYAVERFAGRLVMMSDERGENGIFERNDKANDIEGCGWRLVYAPAGGSTFIEDMTVNRHAITVLERNTKTGLPVVRVLPLSSGIHSGSESLVDVSESYLVPIPDFAVDCQFGVNEEYESDMVELEFRSPIVPSIRINFDVVNKASHMAAGADMEDEFITENNLENYTAVRIPFTSPAGGHIVPLTLAYRNDAVNPSPALWIVYGAYGECMDMSYSPYLMSLMNRGYKIIWCHVRGDGQLGRAFYKAGRRRYLENSSSDLKECMQFMKAKNVANKNAIFSYSAGALTACGALDLADAVVLESPFVNLIDAMHDGSHALTYHEHDEFGDPSDEGDLAVMRRVCPQSSASTSKCPMLVCTGKLDEHVSKDDIHRYARNVGAVLWEDAYEGHLPETPDELLATRAGEMAFLIDAMRT